MTADWENDLNILGLYAKESETALDRIERIKKRLKSTEDRVKLLETFIESRGYDVPS